MGKTIWKQVKGFEDYQVSNMGEVRNKDGKVLHQIDNGRGYKFVRLRGWKSQRKFYVHRLVAFAFIPNPLGKPCINHIDNDPTNNRYDNLEWCTHLENMQWSFQQGRNVRTETWLNNLHTSQKPMYKAVRGVNIYTGEIIEFERLNGVKEMGFHPSCVCNCCKGHRGVTQHAGYRWEYIKS